MPRNPSRKASSVKGCVRSSFHAVPYRKRGTRTPSKELNRSDIGYSSAGTSLICQSGQEVTQNNAISKNSGILVNLVHHSCVYHYMFEMIFSRTIEEAMPSDQNIKRSAKNA